MFAKNGKRTSILKPMIQVIKSFRTGQEFRFPDDDKVYTFWKVEYEDGKEIIVYYEDFLKKRREFSFANLIHV